MLYLTGRIGRLLTIAWMAVGVVACGGGGSSSTAIAVAPKSTLTTNEQAVYVNAGPAGTGYNANRLYTDLTVCQPGTTNCVTVPHVLVDTGSTGLRLLNSVVAFGLNLPRQTDAIGRPLVNCARFVDGSFSWGAVARADIQLGTKSASNVPIQIMADPTVASASSLCSAGAAIASSADIGSNGILGVGLFKEDCGSSCVNSVPNAYYFSCVAGTCVGTKASTSIQVKNPVPLLATDNNGVVIDLPNVGAAPAGGVVGKMILGIGTQANNQLTSGQILATDARGFVTTTFGGKVLRNSFFDSGSNGLYFDTTALPTCTAPSTTSFYCPANSVILNANVFGGSGSSAISFTVDNAVNSFVGGFPVLPGLAGTLGSAQSFDWGLPFFYGRRVFFGIEGMPSSLGTGPFYAF